MTEADSDTARWRALSTEQGDGWAGRASWKRRCRSRARKNRRELAPHQAPMTTVTNHHKRPGLKPHIYSPRS